MTKSKNSVDLAVVGGGPAAVAFLYDLLELICGHAHLLRFNISVFEKATRCGPGLAFSPALAGLVVNQRMSTMGISYDDPQGFKTWLIKYEPRWKPQFPDFDPYTNEHPPRALYGEYVADSFVQLQARATRMGHCIAVVHEEVSYCCDEGDKVLIGTKSGISSQFDKAVLAVGNLPAHSHVKLQRLPHYLHSPWPVDRLELFVRNCANKHIYVLGNSLSAIDTANAAWELGHRGNITLVSRRGWTPKVLGAPPASPYQLKYLTLYRLQQIQAQTEAQTGREHVPLVEIMELLKREVEACLGMSMLEFPWTTLLLPLPDICAALEADLRLAQGTIPWQAMLRATLPLVDCIWTMLSSEDQRTFEKFRSTWNRYRHAMARPTAERFLRLLQSGKAEVLGGLKENDPCPTDDGQAAIFSLGGTCRVRAERHACIDRRETESGAEWQVRAECIVNATGQGTNVPILCQAGLAGDLLANLLADGTISPHPSGGIRFDECWRPLNRVGVPAQNLLVLGHLTMGTLFYVSGMDKVAAMAHDVATVLLNMLEVEVSARRVYPRHRDLAWVC